MAAKKTAKKKTTKGAVKKPAPKKKGTTKAKAPVEKRKLPPVALIERKASGKNIAVMVQNIRGAFVYLDKPNTNFIKEDGTGAEYCLTMLVPQSQKSFRTDLLAIAKNAIRLNQDLTKEGKIKAWAAAQSLGEGGLVRNGEHPDNLSKDGTPYDGMTGMFTVRVKANAEQLEDGSFKPKVPFKVKNAKNVDLRAHEIANLCYSGAWFDVGLNVAAYKNGTNYGVTCYISGIMLLMGDEKLGAVDPFSEGRDDLPTADDEMSGGDPMDDEPVDFDD